MEEREFIFYPGDFVCLESEKDTEFPQDCLSMVRVRDIQAVEMEFWPEAESDFKYILEIKLLSGNVCKWRFKNAAIRLAVFNELMGKLRGW